MKTTQLIAVAIACASAVVCGCSSDDTAGTQTQQDTGTAATDTGTGTLYDRLGKNAGIKSAIDAIVADELKDPGIAAFFANNDGTHAGHPSATQIKECLVLLLGNAAGGPETYPAAVSGGFMCRSMKAAHTGLGIDSATFDKFVTIAAGTLKKAGVADADITTIGGVLNGTKSDIVESTTDAGS